MATILVVEYDHNTRVTLRREPRIPVVAIIEADSGICPPGAAAVLSKPLVPGLLLQKVRELAIFDVLSKMPAVAGPLRFGKF